MNDITRPRSIAPDHPTGRPAHVCHARPTDFDRIESSGNHGGGIDVPSNA